MSIKSSLKRARQENKRRLRNKYWKSRIKDSIKNFQEGISSKKGKEEIESLLHGIIPLIDKAKAKGIFHPNKASRMKSRIQKMYNSYLANLEEK